MKYEINYVHENNTFYLKHYSETYLADSGLVKPFDFFVGEKKCMILQRETGKALFLPKEAERHFLSGTIHENVREQFHHQGFFAESHLVGDSGRSEKPLPSFFLIDLTDSCNFDCTYCFRKHSLSNSTITNERLLAICSYIRDYCRAHRVKRITIQPWGGEPLLQVEKIFWIRHFFTQSPDIHVKIVIETNGSLITRDMAERLLANKIEISVSFDGLPELHDLQRLDQQGRPTAAQVIQGILLAKQAGYRRMGSVCVLTRHGTGRIREILEYCDNVLGLTSIRINPVRQTSGKMTSAQILEAPDISLVASDIIDAQWSMYQQGSSLFEANTWERVRNLLGKNSGSICRSCGCCGGYRIVSFSMNGEIFPCDLVDWKDMKMGDIDDRQDLCDLIGAAENSHAYFAHKSKLECASCPWYYFCRGGCTASLKNEGRLGQGVDERECMLNQQMYPRIIALLLSGKVM